MNLVQFRTQSASIETQKTRPQKTELLRTSNDVASHRVTQHMKQAHRDAHNGALDQADEGQAATTAEYPQRVVEVHSGWPLRGHGTILSWHSGYAMA